MKPIELDRKLIDVDDKKERADCWNYEEKKSREEMNELLPT